MGKLSFTEGGMPGYLEFFDKAVAPVGTCNGMPEPGPTSAYRESLVFPGSPIVLPPPTDIIRAVTNEGVCTIGNATGVPEDPLRGITIVLTPNCMGQLAPGVAVTAQTMDSESRRLYFKNSVPSEVATSTDAEGNVLFLNLPPGASTFTASLSTPSCNANPESCPVIGKATVFIRPQTITYVYLGPSP
jgi:hypothetical protein